MLGCFFCILSVIVGIAQILDSDIPDNVKLGLIICLGVSIVVLLLIMIFVVYPKRDLRKFIGLFPDEIRQNVTVAASVSPG